MRIILITFVSIIGLISCECSGPKMATAKFKEGDIVYIKPDSLKAVITDIQNYGPQSETDNGIRYEVKMYSENGESVEERVKETQIFSNFY